MIVTINRRQARRKRDRETRHGGQNADGRRRAPRHSREKSSTDSSEQSSNNNRRKKKKRRRRQETESSSSSSSKSDPTPSDSSQESDRFLSPEARRAKKKRRKAERDKAHFEAVNEIWDIDTRPDFLKTIKGCAKYPMNQILGMKAEYTKEAERRNMGEDIFLRDGKLKKTRFKAQSDNGTTKLHEVRFYRLPVAHPKEYYKRVPRKQDVIIRSFPMDHYGLEGQVQDAVIGKMHNRAVVQTYDAFGKTSVKTGRGSGKYADRHQLEEALINYGSLMHHLWPIDYSLFPIWRTLHDAKWGETVTSDEKRRSELVIEFFNSMLADNCSKAVHSKYPLVFEQVNNRTYLLKALLIET
jgi:hypothetical protein